MERARPEKKQTPMKVKMGYVKWEKSQPSPRMRALDLNNREFFSLHSKNKYLFNFQFRELRNSVGRLIKSNSKICIQIFKVKISFSNFQIFISLFMLNLIITETNLYFFKIYVLSK